MNDLHSLNKYIASKVVVEFSDTTAKDIYNSVLNFRLVLNDFLGLYSLHSKLELLADSESFIIPKFYKDSDDYKIRDKRAQYYENYIYLIHDYIFELTRSLNSLIKQMYTRYNDNSIMGEKLLFTLRGPDESFRFVRKIVQYFEGDVRYLDLPFPRHLHFMTERGNRDTYIEKEKFDLDWPGI
jgi:hypothetical protein